MLGGFADSTPLCSFQLAPPCQRLQSLRCVDGRGWSGCRSRARPAGTGTPGLGEKRSADDKCTHMASVHACVAHAHLIRACLNLAIVLGACANQQPIMMANLQDVMPCPLSYVIGPHLSCVQLGKLRLVVHFDGHAQAGFAAERIVYTGHGPAPNLFHQGKIPDVPASWHLQDVHMHGVSMATGAADCCSCAPPAMCIAVCKRRQQIARQMPLHDMQPGAHH